MDKNRIVWWRPSQFLSMKSCLMISLVLLFLVVRISLLVLGSEHVSHPAFDETASGVLARDILSGEIAAPFMAYQYELRSGDSLLESLLLVPLFGLCGQSVIVLKAVCVFSALVTLLLWLYFLRCYAGMNAAILFAALFAFAPPTFVRLNLMGTVASHHLINPFIVLQLIVLFRIFETGRDAQKMWLWVLGGMLAGFGAYLFYTYFIFTFFCGLFLFFWGRTLINLKRIGCFGTGFLVGFLPWIYRLKYSTGGSGYLSSIIKNLAIDPWRFVQNFCFNFPHSMGYEYPLRNMGLQSAGFTLLVLVFACFLLVKWYAGSRKSAGPSEKPRLNCHSMSLLVGSFLASYPIFFLICLSLSPMKINPFEYWPNVGLFGNFGTADIYRYRWLHSLFPFYFSVIAIGASAFMIERSKSVFGKSLVCAALIFFMLGGLTKIVALCSFRDVGRLIHYKGYNYDRQVNRFLLGAFRLNREAIKCFPEENQSEVYRCLGVKKASQFLAGNYSAESTDRLLASVPLKMQGDYIYGMVNAGQPFLGKGLPVLFLKLSEQYPDIFYKEWGRRYLASKYYGVLCNQEEFSNKIAPLEKWFFNKELDALFEDIKSNKDDFLNELSAVATIVKPGAVKGVGMLIGAEMLFDPSHSLDYPLDSRFGDELDLNLRKYFYVGVGAGFAETLCRFWRRLLPPEPGRKVFYNKGLEIEWQRCFSLLRMMPENIRSVVFEGFREELSQRRLNDEIRSFLDDKFKVGSVGELVPGRVEY